MILINWSDDLSVGVGEIDNQHKKLIDSINTFYKAMQANDKKAIADLLNNLMEYTMVHFRTEEKYFDAFKYGDSEKHKMEHQIFVDKILDMKKTYDSGKILLSLSVTNFLRDWIKNHIKRTDMKYIKCFQDNGLSQSS